MSEPKEESAYEQLPPKHRRFVDAYVGRARLNQSKAYRMAGYKHNPGNAVRLKTNEKVAAAIKERLNQLAMSDEEAAHIMAEHARGSMLPFTARGKGNHLVLDTSQAGLENHMHLVKKWKQKAELCLSQNGTFSNI